MQPETQSEPSSRWSALTLALTPQSLPEVWDNHLHCSHDLDLEALSLRYAAFVEALARVADALRSSQAAAAAAAGTADAPSVTLEAATESLLMDSILHATDPG